MTDAKKIAVGVEFDGSSFRGWQSQACGQTIQDAVQNALAAVAEQPVVIHAAGRTDAGVHATLMPAHFNAAVLRSPSAWVSGGNARLPPAIRLLWAKPVAANFHARYCMDYRYYQYLLQNRPMQPALLRDRAGFCCSPLALDAMQEAAERLLGEHDFSAFRAAACQAASPIRRLFALRILRADDLIRFDFCGDGFLHHMVRNIVGSLIYVGRGRQPPTWMDALLASGDRRQAGPTASAAGLYFCGGHYPPAYPLPPAYRSVSLGGESLTTTPPYP